MRLMDLEEEEAHGPEDYDEIKAKQYKERNDKKKKADRVTQETGQLQRAQKKVQQQRSDVARAASN
jgi:hypothetical protein